MFVGNIPNNQDHTDYADQHQSLNSFTKENGFAIGGVHTGNNFENVKNIIQTDCEDIFINKISNIDPYLQDVKENLQFCQERKLKLFSIFIDNGYRFDDSILTEDFFKGIDIAIDLRNHLISQSTRKILSQRKKEGKKLGRPFGAKVKFKI